MSPLQAALRDCRQLALESISDDAIPEPVERLAALAGIDTGIKVVAIKHGSCMTIIPSRRVRDLTDWHVRRLCGRPLPSDPAPLKRARPCYSLVVDGSVGAGPIAIESWMNEQGIEAHAVNGHCCQVVLTPEQES